jgi:sensor histidine kinase YesM
MTRTRAVHVLSWHRSAIVGAICLLLSTQVLFQPGIVEYSLESVARGWLDYFAEILLCGLAMWVAVELLAQLRLRPAPRIAAVLAALVGASFVGACVAMLLLQPSGFYPPLLAIFGDALRWAVFGAIVFFARDYLQRETRAGAALEAAAVERASLERRMVEAQLEVLQAQIEPHFLFNTLAHVKRLYEVQPQVGDEMMASLRHYLRAALPRMRETACTIGREAELARAYLTILRLRLGKRLDFAFDIPEDLRSHALPPMVLITLVENAVKHGIAPHPEGGTIEVRASASGSDVEIAVADSGVGFSGSLGNGIGLANIRARLKGVHGDRASLSLRRNDPCGVVASVRVPLEQAAA